MPRKLVTLRRVTATAPIPNADKIEAVSIDGWTCVCKKGEFSTGDIGLFFEIDSFLPADDARWGFLSASFSTFEGARGFRVRSLKIRGQVSQGMLLPLASFPEVEAVRAELVEARGGGDEGLKEALDRSFEELLRVRKWGRPVLGEAGAAASVPFPDFIPRTDQERIQNLPGVFAEWPDRIFQESTKMDGSSMTVFYLRRDSPHHDRLPTFPPPPPPVSTTSPTVGSDHDHDHDHDQDKLGEGTTGVCSRNIQLSPHQPSLFWSVARRLGFPAALAREGRNLALQGELCGSTIQSNFEGFPAGYHDLYVYGAYDIDAQRPLPPRAVEALAAALGVRHVPVHGYFPLRDVGASVADLLARADGKGVNGRRREGIVLKSEDGTLSFKAISNSYLLKTGE